MGQCALTGKKVQFGHNVSHSKRRTKRTFMPNILVFDDQLATATPCTDVQKVLSLGGNKFRRSEILNRPDGVAGRTQLGVLWDELLSLAL